MEPITMTTAIIGYGTTVEVQEPGSPGVWFELGEVTNVTPPNQQTDQHEASHMQSPGRKKEFVAGLTDPGEASYSHPPPPPPPTDEFVIEWRASGETRPMRLTYPNNRRETFDAFVTGWTPTLETNAVAGATLTVKVTGDSTFDVAT
jgi:hypothetical protein